MRMRLLLIAVLICMVVPLAAQAAIQFQFTPSSAFDWQPGTLNTIYVEIRSTETGGEDVGAFEFKFTYNNDPVTGVTLHEELGSIPYYGIDTCSYVSAYQPPPPVPVQGQMSVDLTGYVDDGDVNVMRARSLTAVPPDLGIHVDGPTGDWYRICALHFDVGTNPTYPILIDFYYQKALDGDMNDPGAAWYEWSGDTVFKGWPDEETGIELLSFEATSLEESILLTWETATEASNAGYRLLRAGTANGDYQPITPSLIPAVGDEFSGASYEFTDNDVEAGETYWYKLEDIDINGESTFHGPVDVTVEAEPFFGCGVVEGGNFDFALVLLVLGMAILGGKRMKKKAKPSYKRPSVKTTSSSDVVKKIGPAQTCSPSPTTCPTAQ